MGDYMKRIKKVFSSVIFVCVLAVSIVAVTYILSPKIPSFYKEKKLDDRGNEYLYRQSGWWSTFERNRCQKSIKASGTVSEGTLF